jgi:hypothetical protein
MHGARDRPESKAKERRESRMVTWVIERTA